MEKTGSSDKYWYMLRHPKPRLIKQIFNGEREVIVARGDTDDVRPPFESFIPYYDVQFRPSMAAQHTGEDYNKEYDSLTDGNAMRADLHSFIFLHVERWRIIPILNSSWNRALRHRIVAYRDIDATPIEIGDEEFEKFRNAINQLDFQICKGRPTENVRTGDEVMVIDGPMAGSNGVVTGIRERGGEVTFTIAFKMFKNSLEIEVPNFRLENLKLLNTDAEMLLEKDFISNFENELIELLCHKHGKNGTLNLGKEDMKRLRFIRKYADIAYDNTVSEAKFKALMLVCAYLKGDQSEIEERIRQVEAILNGATEPTNDLECYLMTALFIANHNVELRHKIKAYRQSHDQTCPLPIRRFQSIAKRIKCK